MRRAWSFAVAKARTNFRSFCHVVAPAIVATPPIYISACHEYLMHLAQLAYDRTGYGKRQCVSMAPQHGKSTVLSILFPLWLLGRHPGICVGITGFSQELVTDFSRTIKELMQSDAFKEVFPECELNLAYDRMDYWKTTTNSVLRAKPAGRKFTGQKLNVLIADDVHAGREEAESKVKRNRVKKWFSSDCLSRLAPGSLVFVIATRWHPEDLIGHITNEELNRKLWDEGAEEAIYLTTNLEAICEHPETDPLGRKLGDVLFPEVRNEAFLNSQRATMESYDWDSQYQGRPRVSGGEQVDITKIKRIDVTELPDDMEILRGWDLALSEKQVADFTAGALLGYHKSSDRIFLMDMQKDKKAWGTAKPWIISRSLYDKEVWGVSRIGVEAVTGFEIGRIELASSLLGELRVEKYNPASRQDKLSRAQPWLNKVEAGKFYIVCSKDTTGRVVMPKWVRGFLDELEVFPLGQHDDQVDAVSIAFEAFVKRVRLLAA